MKIASPDISSSPPIQAHDEKLLAFRVLTLGQLLTRGIEIVLDRNLELSVRQWRVIFYLARMGSGSVQDIADFFRYDKSQVSRALTELGERRLVRTTPSSQDRRKVVASLTAAGRKLYERGMPLSQARNDRLVGSLTANELATLESLIDRLTGEAEVFLEELQDARSADV